MLVGADAPVVWAIGCGAVVWVMGESPRDCWICRASGLVLVVGACCAERAKCASCWVCWGRAKCASVGAGVAGVVCEGAERGACKVVAWVAWVVCGVGARWVFMGMFLCGVFGLCGMAHRGCGHDAKGYDVKKKKRDSLISKKYSQIASSARGKNGDLMDFMDILVGELVSGGRSMKRDFVYREASAMQKRMDAWVSAVGHFISRDYHAPLRTRQESLVACCLQGGGTLRMGERTYAFRAGDLLLQPAHVPHICACDPVEGWEVWWVVFGGGYPSRLLEVMGLTAVSPVMTVGDVEPFAGYMARAYEALERGAISAQLDASQQLLLLLFALQKHRQERESDISRLFLEMNYKTQDLDEIVASSGYSKHHLIRRFKQATGVTPWAYVLQLKIDRAKSLLLEPKYSIKEIATEVGFHCPLYFSRIFRKSTGMSPTAFRRLGE